MDSIKIRYTWKRPSDGNIIHRVVSLESLEEKGLILDFSGYRLIARDLWTGMYDAKKNEIYNNDIFDKENEDFYGLVSYNERAGVWIIDWGHKVTDNFTDFHIDHFVVCGNIHTTPELIK